MSIKIDRNRLNGLLGTVIFHLLALIAILGIELGKVRHKHHESFPVDFIEEVVDLEHILRQSFEDIPIPQIEQQAARNIAVNVAEQMQKEIGTENYIEELKKELGIENLSPKYSTDLPDDNTPELRADKKNEQKQAVAYIGKTTISISLQNRKIRYQDVPVYRCFAGGMVVIDIVVNQRGQVIHAVYSNKSKTADECLVEQAVNSAYRFLFNTDASVDSRQTGSITFTFIAQ